MDYETYQYESNYDSSKNQLNSVAKAKIMRMRGKNVLSNI